MGVLMSNTIISTNMSLPVPIVGVDPGPDYAIDINTCLGIIDSHNHAAGYGVPITPSGININADLAFGSNNATLLRSARFSAQGSVLSLASDLNCAFVSGVDLYYNDGNGNHVRLTQGGSVAGTSGSIANLVSPASASYVGGSQTFVWQSDANTPANMDGGSVIIRNILASSNGVTLSAPNALAANYTLTLPAALPASTKILTVSSAGNIGDSYDLDNVTLQVSSSTISVKDSGITTAKISDANVTTVKIADLNVTRAKLEALGQQVSSSCGAFSTSSATFVDVTNLSKAITTTGRPVMILLKSDGSGNDSFVGPASTTDTNNAIARFLILRDGVEIYRGAIGGTIWSGGGSGGQMRGLPGAINHQDGGATAGAHTYKIQTQIGGSAATSHCEYVQLLVWET